MPNHCENDLYIVGKKKDIVQLLARIGSTKDERGGERAIDYHKIIPYPDKFLKMDEAAERWKEEFGEFGEKKPADPARPRPVDGYNSGGYEWCRANWGTKWNAYDIIVDRDSLDDSENYGDDDRISICVHFSSAWAPPLNVIKKLAKDNDHMSFQLMYFEQGAEFMGVNTYKDGEEISNYQGPYYGNRGG